MKGLDTQEAINEWTQTLKDNLAKLQCVHTHWVAYRNWLVGSV